ncbi:MAG TPA: hypothetical protein VIG76_01115 [Amnibacterium sp.]|uniref:hypothetical protein n=1 Tax=Amnibacterium sp. TaxID=1872496 RepID=UPI002F9510A3
MNRNDDAQTDLAALRRAVYARDATPAASEAYAAALAAAGRRVPDPGTEAARPPASEPTIDAPRRHHRWAAVGAASGVAATLMLGALLAGRSAGAPPVLRDSGTVTVAAPAAPAALPVPTSTPLPAIVPPPVPGPVLASLTSTSGAVAAQLDAGGHHVLITAMCGGDGTVSIGLSDGTSTVITCAPGQDGLSMAQSAKPLGRFTVTTSTTGHPIWALTVGVVLSAVE